MPTPPTMAAAHARGADVGRTLRWKQAGWIFFDNDCGFCRATLRRFGKHLRPHHYRFAPIQDPRSLQLLNMDLERALFEMHVLRRNDHRHFGGASAVAHLLRLDPRTWAIGVLLMLPLIKPIADRAYRWVADNRWRLGAGTCGVPT